MINISAGDPGSAGQILETPWAEITWSHPRRNSWPQQPWFISQSLPSLANRTNPSKGQGWFSGIFPKAVYPHNPQRRNQRIQEQKTPHFLPSENLRSFTVGFFDNKIQVLAFQLLRLLGMPMEWDISGHGLAARTPLALMSWNFTLGDPEPLRAHGTNWALDNQKGWNTSQGFPSSTGIYDPSGHKNPPFFPWHNCLLSPRTALIWFPHLHSRVCCYLLLKISNSQAGSWLGSINCNPRSTSC